MPLPKADHLRKQIFHVFFYHGTRRLLRDGIIILSRLFIQRPVLPRPVAFLEEGSWPAPFPSLQDTYLILSRPIR